VDCFTCGGTDPATIADYIQEELTNTMPNLILERRSVHERFLYKEA
jgi:S-adenosylmethionine/arginine decarboxylase-like enzyme